MFHEGTDTYTEYNGELYHSQTEAAWAAYWDSVGVDYVHWPATCVMPSGRWYTPDFYLPDTDLIVEVKNGNASESDAFLVEYLGYLTNTASALFDGKPRNVAAYFFSPTFSYLEARNNPLCSDVHIGNRRWLINIGENFPHTKDALWQPESLFITPSAKSIQNANDYLSDLHTNRYPLASTRE